VLEGSERKLNCGNRLYKSSSKNKIPLDLINYRFLSKWQNGKKIDKMAVKNGK